MILTFLLLSTVICPLLPLLPTKDKEKKETKIFLESIKIKVSSFESITTIHQHQAKNQSIEWFSCKLEKAQEQGIPIIKSINLFLNLLNEEHKFQLKKQAYFVNHCTKIISMLLIALLGRFFIVHNFNIELSVEDQITDQIFVAMSLLLQMINLICLVFFTPTFWLWDSHISQLGKDYISSFLFLSVENPSPWQNRWKTFEELELLNGFSNSPEKYQLLKNWKIEQNLQTNKKLQAFKNASPILELVCGVFSAILVILLPILNMLQIK